MLSSPDARFLPASDRSLLVQFSGRIDLKSHALVTKLVQILEAAPVAGVLNFHPAYSSLLITFDSRTLTHAALEEILRKHLNRGQGLPFPAPRLVEIPVSYGGDHGPDLIDLAALRGIPPEDVCSLHAATEYTVYFLGFVPGFAYLGEVPHLLATPRLAIPRKTVPAGSVGIAGKQTGIYPLPTPGGWRLIGRTPLPMFDPEAGSRLRIGDRVRFVPISKEQYAALEREQAKA